MRAVILTRPDSDAVAVIGGERIVEEGGGDLIVGRREKAAQEDNPGRAARITVAGDEVVLDRYVEAIVGGPVVIRVGVVEHPSERHDAGARGPGDGVASNSYVGDLVMIPQDVYRDAPAQGVLDGIVPHDDMLDGPAIEGLAIVGKIPPREHTNGAVSNGIVSNRVVHHGGRHFWRGSDPDAIHTRDPGSQHPETLDGIVAGENIEDVKGKAHRPAVEGNIRDMVAIHVAIEGGMPPTQRQGAGEYDGTIAEAGGKFDRFLSRGVVGGNDCLA